MEWAGIGGSGRHDGVQPHRGVRSRLLSAVLGGGLCAALAWSVAAPAGAIPRGPAVGGGRSSVTWPQFHATAGRVGLNSSETKLSTKTVGSLRLKWRAWTRSTSGSSGSAPAVVNGTIYVGSDDGNVYALRASDGSVVWKYKTGGAVDSSPAVVSGIVYVGSGDGKIYALDASTGARIWSYTTGAKITTAAALVVNNTVYMGSYDGTFYALNASNGSLVWRVNNLWQMHKGAAYAGGIVYVGSDQSKLFAFDATTGATKWTATLGGMVRSNPSVSGGIVYVGCDDGRLYAFNAITGKLSWKTPVLPGPAPVWVRSTPAVANSRVFVTTSEGTSATADGHAYAFNALTGIQVWADHLPDMSLYSPVVANGIVYSSGYGFNFYAYAAPTGAQLWNAGFNTFKGNTGSPAVVNGNVYFLNMDGYLYDYGL